MNEEKTMEELERLRQLAGILSEGDIHNLSDIRKGREEQLKRIEQLNRTNYAYFQSAAEMLATAMEYVDEVYQELGRAEDETNMQFLDIKDETLRISNEIATLINKIAQSVKK